VDRPNNNYYHENFLKRITS